MSDAYNRGRPERYDSIEVFEDIETGGIYLKFSIAGTDKSRTITLPGDAARTVARLILAEA